jgi:hypothetical protein
MVQDGKVDRNRLFIFSFTHLPEGYCGVTTITVNNLSCGKDIAMVGTQGPWLNYEYCNEAYCGDEFKCDVRTVSNGRTEITVNDREITHRLIVGDHNRLLDYAGTLSKFSDITRKVETATYIPIISKTFSNYSDVDLACPKLAVPALLKGN